MIKSVTFLLILGWMQYHAVNAAPCLELGLEHKRYKNKPDKLIRATGDEMILYYEVLNEVLLKNGLSDWQDDGSTLGPLFHQLEEQCRNGQAGSNSERREFNVRFPDGWGPDFDPNERYQCEGDTPDEEYDDGGRALVNEEYDDGGSGTRALVSHEQFLAVMEGGNERKLWNCGCYPHDCILWTWCCAEWVCCYDCRRRLGRGLLELSKEKLEKDLRDACKAKRSEGLRCMDCNNPIVKLEC